MRRGGVGGGAPLQRALSTDDCVPYFVMVLYGGF